MLHLFCRELAGKNGRAADGTFHNRKDLAIKLRSNLIILCRVDMIEILHKMK